jgi:hypothetical protein
VQLDVDDGAVQVVRGDGVERSRDRGDRSDDGVAGQARHGILEVERDDGLVFDDQDPAAGPCHPPSRAFCIGTLSRLGAAAASHLRHLKGA